MWRRPVSSTYKIAATVTDMLDHAVCKSICRKDHSANGGPDRGGCPATLRKTHVRGGYSPTISLTSHPKSHA